MVGVMVLRASAFALAGTLVLRVAHELARTTAQGMASVVPKARAFASAKKDLVVRIARAGSACK